MRFPKMGIITKVDVATPGSGTLTFSTRDSSAGYLVKEITGLDPVDAILSSTSMAQLDGEQFQNARRGPRNITMKLGLEGVPSLGVDVDALRSTLYSFLLPKSSVTMTFYKNDVAVAKANGIVETCQAPLFTDKPEANISVVCYDPDLYAITRSDVSGNTVTDATLTTINYQGSSESGFVFFLNVNRTLSGFTMYNTWPDNNFQKFDVQAGTLFDPFVAGDVVTFISLKNGKFLYLTRSGAISPLLMYVDRTSTWPTFKPGANKFRVQASGAAVPWTLNYFAAYGGL
jgi:Phage tail protein